MDGSSPLRPASQGTIEELRRKASEVVSAASTRYNEVETTKSMSADAHQQMVVDGLQITTRMLDSFLAVASKPLIREHTKWLAVRLPHEGLSFSSIIAGLRIYRDALSEKLTAGASAEIVPFLDFMIDELERVAGQGNNETGQR